MSGNQPDTPVAFSKTTPLYGLLLAGGQSKRMGKDKAILVYHDQSQIKYGFKLLSGFCEKVFLSNRPEQSQRDIYKDHPQIQDIFPNNIGPMAGILSALRAHPAVAWLVLGCDLPFVDNETLRLLVQNRNPLKTATAYLNSDGNLPEPLCAIYEPQSWFCLLRFFDSGIYSLRKFLVSADTHLLKQPGQNELWNVNTLEEYHQAVELLKGEHC